MKELALNILDIAQNSITAGARNIGITVEENEAGNFFRITVVDDGCGMSEEMVQRVTDPYFTSRTTRKVGMGIPLFKHSAEQAGGNLIIESEIGKGTTLKASFEHNHIDRPVLGDIAGVMALLIGANPDIRFLFHYKKNKHEFSLDTNDVIETLDGIPVNEPEVLKFIREMINDHIKSTNCLSKG